MEEVDWGKRSYVRSESAIEAGSVLAMSSTVGLERGSWYLEARCSSSCMAAYVMVRRSSGSDVNISANRYCVDVSIVYYLTDKYCVLASQSNL